MSIFRAYDIRGLYEKEITSETAFNLGHAFTKFLRCKTVVIGHDMRDCAPEMTKSLQDGLVEAGCKVTSIGLCTTPMLYYALGKQGLDGGIMVTASHNPKEYIGFKLSREEVIPIGGGSGMDQIEQLCKARVRVRSPLGSVHLMDVTQEYRHFVKGLVNQEVDGLKVVVDCANGMGALDFEHMKAMCGSSMEWHGLYTELDGSFPNHEANPINPKCMEDLQQAVLEKGAHLGIAFDGDADRVGFVDEKGTIVEGDLTTLLIAQNILESHPKEHFLYDLRSSNVVREEIAAQGGTASMCRVGHGFIKKQMRDENAMFGGELSCHFYFRDTFYTDSGLLCAMRMLALLSKSEKSLSELVEPMRKYARSGEINRRVEDADAIIETITEKYKDSAQLTTIDGIRLDFDEYWFNVRKSNTEPLLRLVVEAKEQKKMEEVRDEILDIMGGEQA